MNLFARLRQRHPIVWVVWLAMVLGALAPGVSRTLASAASEGGLWVEVCTPSGIRWVSPAEALGEADAGSGLHAGLDHCAFCVLGVDRLAGLRDQSLPPWAEPRAPQRPEPPVERVHREPLVGPPPVRGPPLLS